MPGPARRPSLQVVREGNPGKRPVPEQIAVPPADFAEPDWLVEFPVVKVPPPPARPDRDDFESDDAFQSAMNRWVGAMSAWGMQATAAEGSEFCRQSASAEWSRTVPVLQVSVGLGNVDYSTVYDMCICVARLLWCEHRLSVEGLVTMGQRGPCRNPLTTVATQYRTQLKTYIRELGMSPAARSSIPGKPGGDDDDDDVFD